MRTAFSSGVRLVASLTVLLAVGALLPVAPLRPELSTRPAEAQACTVRVGPADDLRAVVQGVAPGSVVCLRSGTYGAPLRLEFRPGVVLRGDVPGPLPVIDGQGISDGVLVLNSSGVTLENLEVRNGQPANVYAYNSPGLTMRNVVVSGGGIGVHLDQGSAATIERSAISKMRADGVLLRRGSSATVASDRIAQNGGVGVSAVGDTGDLIVRDTEIAANGGPGVFAGKPPCALLPPASLDVAPCFRRDLASFVGRAHVQLDRNSIRDNGSTGLVFFPGTYGVLRDNVISGNKLTGLFAWGARVNVFSNRFDENEEHAVEYRAYPSPEDFGRLPPQFPMRASGQFVNNVVTNTLPLSGVGLGGGLLSQGGDLKVLSSSFWRNAGIGVSFVNQAQGEIKNNSIIENGGGAICLYRAGSVTITSNLVGGNQTNRTGQCV